MRVIVIGGEPGTGKTTLMKDIMSKFDLEEHFKDFFLVPYYATPRRDLFVLGIYNKGEVFGGTDKMSMAVQPSALAFLDDIDESNTTVLLEGDRLFNNSFLEACKASGYDLHVIVLRTSDDLKIKRYAERGSEQDPVWLKGRKSKVENVTKNLTLLENLTIFDHNTPEDTIRIRNYIMELL